MIVSVNTSSNYSTAWKTGSFAYWISFMGGRMSQCGLSHGVQNREDCQLWALIQAMERIEASRLRVSRIVVYVQHLSIGERLAGCAIFFKIKEKWPRVVFDFKISEIAHETCRTMAKKVLRQSHNH